MRLRPYFFLQSSSPPPPFPLSLKPLLLREFINHSSFCFFKYFCVFTLAAVDGLLKKTLLQVSDLVRFLFPLSCFVVTSVFCPFGAYFGVPPLKTLRSLPLSFLRFPLAVCVFCAPISLFLLRVLIVTYLPMKFPNIGDSPFLLGSFPPSSIFPGPPPDIDPSAPRPGGWRFFFLPSQSTEMRRSFPSLPP